MTDQNSNTPGGNEIPEAVKVDSSKRKFSAIWIVPVTALVIGLFLIFRLVTETGPTITISFEEGSGMEVGKTKVKYRDIDIGEVSEINLKDDATGVIVSVEMSSAAKAVLTDKTRFWVVKPSISGGNVSGLSTLLSGSYIGIDPSREGKPQKSFVGLEREPIIRSADEGTRYTLRADSLGSLETGSPIYYKKIQVGQIASFELIDDDIMFEVFIDKPYDDKIRQGTRFWNVSGFDVTLSADGLTIDTESLVTIIAGGVAFDTPPRLDDSANSNVAEGHEFRLYANKAASRQREFKEKRMLVMYFEDPIRGLLPGASVEVRGFKVGQVSDVRVDFNRATGEFSTPVLVELEPERIAAVDEGYDFQAIIVRLVDKGLRASLKTGNLLTGKLYINLEFYPDAPEGAVDFSGKYPVFPTIRGTLNAITEDARVLIAELRVAGKNINAFLESEELQSSLSDLSATMSNIKLISEQVDQDAMPKISAILRDAEATLSEAEAMFASNSATRTEINRILIELAEAAQSIRLLADYLEQNPETLIRGKD